MVLNYFKFFVFNKLDVWLILNSDLIGFDLDQENIISDDVWLFW
jgi:hypothetical protein